MKKDILSLRPTQFVLGLKEVESKVEKMSKMTGKDLQKFCDEHVIPTVIGPKQQIFLIDHHHFARACWETKVEGFSTKVEKDMSQMNEYEFWNFMIKKDWVYLHDQFGLGPHKPADLPADIRGLADDPYRSLAWAVRDQGGFNKEDVPFFEFKWAAFFRHNLTIPLHSKSDFKDALKLAMKLADSKEAKHLPGAKG